MTVAKKHGKTASQASAETKTDDEAPEVRAGGVLSHDAAVERVRVAQMEMLPTFLKCGLIRASNGWYKVAQHKDGRTALFFARNMEDLSGVARDGKQGTYPGPDKKIWVVDAKPKRTVEKWELLAIMRHQRHLDERRIKKGMLYQTGGDTWQNEAVSYKIFPTEDISVTGKQHYTLRLYSRARAEEDFVPVDEKTPRGILGNVFSTGENEGRFTRLEAKHRIAEDFNKRAKRIKFGEDPLTPRERGTNPRWWLRRSIEKYRSFMAKTPASHKAAMAVETALTAVLSWINPFELLSKLGSILMPRLAKMLVRDPVQINIAETLGIRKEGWKFNEMQCIEADPEKVAGFKFLSAAEAKAHYDNVPVYKELSPKWPKEYILGALNGREGAIAHPRTDGVLSIQETNGLMVYYLPAHRTAFARMRSEWKRDGDNPLPPQVEKLFAENAGEILEITKTDEKGIDCRFMAEDAFRKEIARLSDNPRWVEKICDDFCSDEPEKPNLPQKKPRAVPHSYPSFPLRPF